MEFMEGNWSYLWFWILVIQIFLYIRIVSKYEVRILAIANMIPSLEKEILGRELEYNKIKNKLKEIEEKEKFLLKTINDSMSVIDPKGFISQRMKNAPKHFTAADPKDYNLDKVNS